MKSILLCTMLLKMEYTICFSGGRSSALALYMMLDKVRSGQAVVLFNNTGKERLETLDFVQAVSENWNIPIVWIEYENTDIGYKVVDYKTASRLGEPFAAAIDKKRGFLPNRVIRYCTEMLKIIPTKKYLKDNSLSGTQKVLGIRYDEPMRVAKQKGEHYLPLNVAKITKSDVRKFWANQPFDLQLKDYQGNCDLCMLKGKNKRLTLIAENPEIITWWVEQESKSGGRFDKDGTLLQLAKIAEAGNFKRAKDLFDIGQADLFSNDFSDDSISCFCGD